MDDTEWYEEIDAPELAAILQGRCEVRVPGVIGYPEATLIGYSLHRGHLYSDVDSGYPPPGMVTFLRRGTPHPMYRRW